MIPIYDGLNYSSITVIVVVVVVVVVLEGALGLAELRLMAT